MIGMLENILIFAVSFCIGRFLGNLYYIKIHSVKWNIQDFTDTKGFKMTPEKLREYIKRYPNITTVGELARLINSQK